MIRRLPSILLVAILCAYVLASALALLGRPVGEFDESIPLVLGRLVRQGLVPHRDFFSFYPPLNLYLNAAAFSILGETVVAQRMLNVLSWAGLLLVFWGLLRRLVENRVHALAALLLFAATCYTPLLGTQWIAFCLSFSAVILFASASTQQRPLRRRDMVVCGALSGLALLTRVNFGLYATSAIVLALLLGCVQGWERPRWKTVCHAWLLETAVFLAPLAACAAAWLLPYGSRMRAPLEQAVLFPSAMMPAHRFIELPVDPWLLYGVTLVGAWLAVRSFLAERPFIEIAFPLALGGLACAAVLMGRGAPRIAVIVWILALGTVAAFQLWTRRLAVSETGLLLFYCGLTHYALSRAEAGHLLPLATAAAGLLPFLAQAWPQSGPPARTVTVALLAALAANLTSPWFRPMLPEVRQGLDLMLRGGVGERLSDASRMAAPAPEDSPWRRVYEDADQLAAIRYVRERTGPGEPVFAGIHNHSNLFANNVRTYWLLDRPIPSPYVNFEPGLVTEPHVQEQIIRALQECRVTWIVLGPPPGADESFRNRRYQGSRLLDDFIRANYKPAAAFGGYAVLKRGH